LGGQDSYYIQTGLKGRKSEQREDTAAGRLAAYILGQIPAGFDVYADYALAEEHQAQAVADACGRYIRYCPEIGWLAYHEEDGCWREPYAESAVQRLITHFGELRLENAEPSRPEEERFAKSCLSGAGISAVKKILKHHTKIIIRQDELDSNPDLLNCKGDLYDLRKGAMRKAEPEDLITKTTFCKAEAAKGGKKKEAVLPEGLSLPPLPENFEAFMRKITGKGGVERLDLVYFILFFFGYSLTGDTGASFFVNFHGQGKNGKSVLLKLMLALFGDYAAPVPRDVVIENRFGSQFDLAGLPGIRLGILADAPEGRLNMELLKPLVSGDTLSAKRKFLKDFAFKPELKIAVGSNPRLTLKDTGMAVKRRIRMVPFDYTVTDEEEVINLDKVLLEEAPGILAALIRLANWYYRLGGGPRAFPPCPTVDEASREYMESEDLVGRYVKERIEAAPGAAVKSTELYKDFQKWEEGQGIRKKMSQTKFGDRLLLFAPRKERKASGVFYFDIAIKSAGDG
jgi:putative DNA primase/helicase